MSALSDDERDDDESPWQFDVDEVGEEAVDPDEAAIEPESPRMENAAFVLLGVVLSGLIFYAAFGSL
jgi:hypothetical protein